MAYNIADLFEHAADLYPERVAVVCGERHVTFRQLEERANRLAHYLAGRGVHSGAHIGVYTHNSIEAVESMIAAYKLRAVAINVNYRYVPNELRYLFDNADLTALVYERQYTDKVAAVLPDTPQLQEIVAVEDGSESDGSAVGAIEYEAALSSSSPARDFGERSSDDLYVLYTGGTTGMPKGVMWRQEDVWRVLGGGINFITGERQPDEWAQAREGEHGGLVRLPVPPMIHGAAQWATFGALFAGSTVVLVPHFDAHEVWRAIERHRVNVLAIVGDAMARPLIEAYHEGQYDASSLVAMSSSAALFSSSVQRQFLDAMPNLFISDSVGSSETGFNGMSQVGKDAEQAAGGPRVQVDDDTRVIDENGRFVKPGSERIGLLARSGHVPLGYYKDPDKTAEVFTEVDGKRYVMPGDYARVETDGSVTLLGRGNVCVNTGGEKVFPEEVEGALKSHPDVFDVLVVGVPDERLGQRVAALVQPRPGTRPQLSELDEHARAEIAGYKVPRSLWLVDTITRSPSGKPDYTWARKHTEQHAPEK